MRLSRLLPVFFVLALLAIPAAASASTLDVTSGAFTYTGSGSANGFSFNTSPGSFNLSDTENITVSGNGSCSGSGTTNVSCSTTPTSVDVDTGGGNDNGSVSVQSFPTAFPITVQAGTGDDNVSVNASFSNGTSTATLDDTSGNDTLSLNATGVVSGNGTGYGTVSGGIGNDTVSGSDIVNGGAGNDILRGFQTGSHAVTLNGNSEDDTFLLDNGNTLTEVVNGGGGIDTDDWTGSGNAVIVSLDSVTNDGPVGSQNDNANADGSVEILKTGQGNDSLTGGPGNDQLFSGSGNDTINGGGGDDFIDGQAGADVMNGGTNGAGGDTVDYSTRAAPLRVSPDGVAANDGEAGEFDNVGSDVENLVGGFNNDSFGGNANPNNYNAGLGDDTLDGSGGNDTLNGGSGRDQIDGGPNNDTLSGGPGDDTIDAGLDNDVASGDAGADYVDGNLGTDTINGGDGSDTMLSREPVAAPQADTVNCGSGTDHSVHDAAGDTINADCEISDTGSAGFGVGSPLPHKHAAVLGCADAKRSAKSGRARVRCTVTLKKASNALLRAKLVRKGKVAARAKRRGSGAFTLRTGKHAKKGVYRAVVSRNGVVIAKDKVHVK